MVDEKQFLEDLMWTSYRYCIGRHTYVTMLAKDMGEYFYDKLSDERKQFIAEDIRSSIGDYLHYQSFNFTFDYTVPRNERKPSLKTDGGMMWFALIVVSTIAR